MLDRKEQVRHALDLVDDEEPVVADEQAGVRLSGFPKRRLIEIPQFRSPVLRYHEPRERALACLPSAVDHDHPGIAQSGCDGTPGVSREQCLG